MLNRIPARALLLLAFAFNAQAADPFYLGTWTVTSAVVAPWWKGPQPPDAAEKNALLGKTIVIAAQRISGPRQFACQGPHYQVKDYPADMLYQGGFGEMHERDKTVDPVKVAASVGFKGTAWKTLETGCATELDFHFLDPSTASVALNNYLFTLKKR